MLLVKTEMGVGGGVWGGRLGFSFGCVTLR